MDYLGWYVIRPGSPIPMVPLLFATEIFCFVKKTTHVCMLTFYAVGPGCIIAIVWSHRMLCLLIVVFAESVALFTSVKLVLVSDM